MSVSVPGSSYPGSSTGSILGSGSATPASVVAATAVPAAALGTAIVNQAISDKQDILALLGIPVEYAIRTDRSLQDCYLVYKSLVKATVMHKLPGAWLGPKMDQTEVIELFISKSFFHSHWKKNFTRVSDHPLMVEWLEKTTVDGEPSDKEVWGEGFWSQGKAQFGFKELDRWLTAKQEKKGKGKGKAKAKEPEAGPSKKKKVGK